MPWKRQFNALWWLGTHTCILFISLWSKTLIYYAVFYNMQKTWRVNFFFWIELYQKIYMFSRNRKQKITEVLRMGSDWNLSKLKPWRAGNTGAGFSAPTFPLRDLIPVHFNTCYITTKYLLYTCFVFQKGNIIEQ